MGLALLSTVGKAVMVGCARLPPAPAGAATTPSPPACKLLTIDKAAHLAPLLPPSRLGAGGTGVFKPLAGVIRSLPSPISSPVLVRAAHQLDRLAVALDTRPQLRTLLMLYFLLLHLLPFAVKALR